MDGVPDTPSQATRTAVTERIVAHVTRGWPRLGEPVGATADSSAM